MRYAQGRVAMCRVHKSKYVYLSWGLVVGSHVYALPHTESGLVELARRAELKRVAFRLEPFEDLRVEFFRAVACHVSSSAARPTLGSSRERRTRSTFGSSSPRWTTAVISSPFAVHGGES